MKTPPRPLLHPKKKGLNKTSIIVPFTFFSLHERKRKIQAWSPFSRQPLIIIGSHLPTPARMLKSMLTSSFLIYMDVFAKMADIFIG